MTQCEHDFQVDPIDGQVRCIKCGDLDDEMQSTNPVVEPEKDQVEFDKSQVTFE